MSRRQFGLATLAMTGAAALGKAGSLLAGDVTAVTPSRTRRYAGSLFLVGGSANQCFKEFVKLAGGKAASITILPHASSDPKATSDSERNEFFSLGVRKLQIVMPNTPDAITKGSAVWMSGGDQTRLVQLLTPALLTQILDIGDAGGLVGGTSAGAAAAALMMIAGGMTDGDLKADELKIVSGLGLLPTGVVVDTHVLQRSRFDRGMAAISMVTDLDGKAVANPLCISLDEDTAVYITQGTVKGTLSGKVYGDGHVHLFRRGKNFKSDLSSLKARERASVWNAEVSSLAPGIDFDL